VPEENTYVYFRHDDEETVMVVLNGSQDAHVLELERFEELLGGYRYGRDIISGAQHTLGETLEVPGMTPMILELSVSR